MRRRDVLLKAGTVAGGALAAGLLPRSVRAACEIFPPDGVRDFQVLRQDQVVGHHRIAFSRAVPGHAKRFVVRSDVKIEVPLSETRSYRFTHHAEEVWRDGWLDALVSDSDDNGWRYRVRSERRDGIFQGTVNGAAFTVSGYVVPSSLWNHDTVSVEALLDTVDGKVKIVRPSALGSEEVPVGGEPVLAQHYALYGQFAREVWYDMDCRLVRAAQSMSDGAPLILELA